MKGLVRAVLGAVVGAMMIVAPPTFAADLGQGAQTFSANCAACHIGGGNAVMANKTLKLDALEQYLDGYGAEHSVDAIVSQVTNGKNAMPSFKGRLTEEQIANVAAYVSDRAEKGW